MTQQDIQDFLFLARIAVSLLIPAAVGIGIIAGVLAAISDHLADISEHLADTEVKK